MKKNTPDNVLIIGINGFIGSHVKTRLESEGYAVMGIDMSGPSVADRRFIRADITKPGPWQIRARGFSPRWVIHLGQKLPNEHGRAGNQNLFDDPNISGLLNVFYSMDKDCNLLFFSSGQVYGNGRLPFREESCIAPESGYALNKAACELLIRSFSRGRRCAAVIARPSVIYGPGQKNNMLVPYLIQSAVKNRTAEMTRGEQTRDFIYVEDVTGAVSAIIKRIKTGFYIFNIGSAREVAVGKLSDMIARLSGSTKRPRRNLPYRKDEQWRYCLDITKIKNELGWRPLTGLEKGLKQTICAERLI